MRGREGIDHGFERVLHRANVVLICSTAMVVNNDTKMFELFNTFHACLSNDLPDNVWITVNRHEFTLGEVEAKTRDTVEVIDTVDGMKDRLGGSTTEEEKIVISKGWSWQR